MAVDKTLPGEEFFHRQRVAFAGFFEAEDPARTAATTSALRRMTQRFVSGGGRLSRLTPDPMSRSQSVLSASRDCG